MKGLSTKQRIWLVAICFSAVSLFFAWTYTTAYTPAFTNEQRQNNFQVALNGTWQHNAYKKCLAKLGMSATERACEDHTGLTLVERFRATRRDWCKNAGGNGRVECFLLPGWGTRINKPDTICEAYNLVLDFGAITWKPPSGFDSSGKSMHFKFGKGSFSAQCKLDNSAGVNFKTLAKLPQAMWTNFQEVPRDHPVDCDVVYKNPVVIMLRYEAWNLYHQLGEWINAFTTLEVVDKLDKNTQLLLLDMHETTEPYTEMLQIFSPGGPLVLGKELVGKGKVCFKDAIMPWEGYATFIHNNVWRAQEGEPCYHSDILEAFSHYVLNKLGVLDQNIANEPRITLISRRDYMGRTISRKIINEDDVVTAIKEVGSGRASFTAVQLEGMTFKEQVETMYAKTNILIGVHGAGLTHTLFLPPEAILIELLPRSHASFAYFRNLAKQSNRIYIPIHVAERGENVMVDTEKMKKVLDVAISIASSFNRQIGKE